MQIAVAIYSLFYLLINKIQKSKNLLACSRFHHNPFFSPKIPQNQPKNGLLTKLFYSVGGGNPAPK